MNRFIAIISTWVLSATIWTLGALADDIRLTVEAPSTVEAGDQFRVRFTVNSQNVSNFVAPDFKGFEVIYGPATSRQSSFQMVNGRTTQNSSITFTYVLIASKPGTFTIGTASIQSDGTTAKSRPLQVRVMNIGSGAAASSAQQGNAGAPSRRQQSQQPSSNSISPNELFMTATASRTNVYEQEAILLTYKLYTTVNLTDLTGKLPTLDGFQIQEIPLPRNKEFQLETYNGRNYHTVVWSQYVLFPQKTGKLVIPSITYEGVVVQANRNIDPIDAFFNGTSGMVELKKKIATPTLTIQVSPLPAAPEGFSHAVGDFTISSSLSADDVKANDALTLKIVVNGTGNMKLIRTPEVAFPKDFETYDAKVSDNLNLTRNGLTGSKTFEYLVVPRHAGKYTIPSVKFAYFDLASREYKTLTTPAYTIKVSKGSGSSAQSVSDYSGSQQEVQQLNNDIRYIKKGSDNRRPARLNAFLQSWHYALAYLVPLCLFVLIIILGRKRIKSSADLAAARGRKANKVARRRLKLAAQLLKRHDQDHFYDEVLKALYGYTADKLNIPREKLNKDNVQQELMAKGVQPELIDQFLNLIATSEFARYAPGDPNANMETVYTQAINLIGSVENGMKR